MYLTRSDALLAGAVTWNWGKFLQAVINFFIVTSLIFFVVKFYSAAFVRKKPELKKDKKCDYCWSDIPIKATICKFCCCQVAVKDDIIPIKSHNF
jgi:large conductance mechanosensitive channel